MLLHIFLYILSETHFCLSTFVAQNIKISMFSCTFHIFHQISDDLNYILSQIEKQDGLQSGQEEEIIPMLWNKRELAYKQLREYELQLKELRLEDNNIVDGLKVGKEA